MKKTYAIGILLGLAAIVLYVVIGTALSTQEWDFPIQVGLIALIYLTAGVVLGWKGQTVNLLMGLLISAPIMAVALFSMFFTGIFTRFLDRDLPIMITTALAPCIGVIIGGRLTRPR